MKLELSGLPEELLLKVLQYLALEDLCRVQRACKRLRDAVETPELWENLYRATFPHLGGSCSVGGGGSSATSTPLPQPFVAYNGSSEQKGETHHADEVDAGSYIPCVPSGAATAAALAALPDPINSSDSTKQRRTDPLQGQRPPALHTSASSLDAKDWHQLFKARFVEQSRQQRLQRQARRLKAQSSLQLLQHEVHRLEASLAQERRQLPALKAQLGSLQRARQQAGAAALAQVYWQPVAVTQAHVGRVTAQTSKNAEAQEADLQQQVAVSELEVRKLSAALAARRKRLEDARRRLQALLP